MFEIAGLKPFFTLAQLNTSVGAPGSAPAASPPPTVERPSGGTPAATGAGGAPASTGAAGSATQGSATQNVAPKGGFDLMSVLPIILMFVLLYLFLFRGQRKDEKKRKAMISTLKKGDRVMTIGGMLASVVSVEGDEVVLKIDESANVKARYRKSSIQEVIDRDEKK